jgi:mRNA-degrading endonuclease RelE of RelBE toxin-antitoxin system
MSRLPEKVVTAVASFVEGPLALNPKRTTKELREPYAGKRSGRVGKAYRVIVSLDEDSRTVRILAVDHRSDVYRVRP